MIEESNETEVVRKSSIQLQNHKIEHAFSNIFFKIELTFYCIINRLNFWHLYEDTSKINIINNMLAETKI